MPETTPLTAALERANAVMTEEFGWQVPAHFGDPAAEYQAAQTGAVLFDVSHRGKVEVSGPDAASFLQNLATNDVRRLAPGFGCETFFTNAQARVLGHGLAFHLVLQNWPKSGERRDVYWLDVAPGNGDKIARHMGHYLVSEQAAVADITREYAQIHLAGSQAPAVLEKALRGEVQLAELQDAERTFRNPSLLKPGARPPEGAAQQATAMIRIPAMATCHVRRHSQLWLPGYDIICQANRAETVWQYLAMAGAQPAGVEAFNALRIEAGTPVYGADIDETNLAPEVGRTPQAVSYSKGCFLGQEPIVRIRDLGHVNRTLVGLKIAGDADVPRGAKLFHEGKEAGQVTSVAKSPRLGTVALAYARRESQKPGTKVEVDTGAGRRPAEVKPLPFGE
jgi:folate-binding protein YgfZ